jgi:hypothetical protein
MSDDTREAMECIYNELNIRLYSSTERAIKDVMEIILG